MDYITVRTFTLPNSECRKIYKKNQSKKVRNDENLKDENSMAPNAKKIITD